MKLFYSGDVSIENGGYFYSLANWKWGYVDAFRVCPASDHGGPDNVFYLEELTVNLRSGPELVSVLSTCGLTPETLPKGAARRHALVGCHVSCGCYDCESVAVVRIGPACPFTGDRESPRVTHYLRASVNLQKLARTMARGIDLTACVKPLEGPHKTRGAE